MLVAVMEVNLRAAKNKPYSVVLFDEIEKANVHTPLLLQLLDDGHLTDSLKKDQLKIVW